MNPNLTIITIYTIYLYLVVLFTMDVSIAHHPLLLKLSGLFGNSDFPDLLASCVGATHDGHFLRVEATLCRSKDPEVLDRQPRESLILVC